MEHVLRDVARIHIPTRDSQERLQTMAESDARGTVPSPSTERRGAPRLQLVSPLVGQDDYGDDVTLMNISEGGLLVHTTQPSTVGEVRHLRFRVGPDNLVTEFAARVVHVLRISGAEGASYAIGLEFVTALPEETRRALGRIAALPGGSQ